MSESKLTTRDRTDDPTNPAFNVVDGCDDCGIDFPCFRHHVAPCPNGRYDCDGSDCRKCQRAHVAVPPF